MIKTITKENFNTEIEGAQTPALVELWAPWCVYCRRLAPALSRLAQTLDGKVAIGQINIDDEPQLGEQLGAEVIPVLYLYQNGVHGEKLVAPTSQAQVEEWINSQLT